MPSGHRRYITRRLFAALLPDPDDDLSCVLRVDVEGLDLPQAAQVLLRTSNMHIAHGGTSTSGTCIASSAPDQDAGCTESSR